MVGGGGGGGQEASMHQAATSFAVFAAGNIGLNYFNSWALRASPVGVPGLERGGFSFPFFYTMFHMGASALAALLLMSTCAKPKHGGLPTFKQLWDYKYQLFPIATLTVLNNGLNNCSLSLVALFINQVIKACGPLPTCIFEYILMGKTYGWKIYASVILIVVGSVLSNAAQFVGGAPSSALGITYCLISLLAASLRPVLQKIIMSDNKDADAKPPLSPSQALFWDMAISFVALLVIWLVGNEREPSMEYLMGHTNNPHSGLLAIGIILAGSTMAFAFNIAIYYYILFTSALTSTVGSNGIKIILICASAITDHIFNPFTWSGIGIVVIAIVAYAYFSYLEKNAPKPAAGTDSKAEPLAVKSASPADEQTPLTRQITNSIVQYTSAFPLIMVGVGVSIVVALASAIIIPIVVVNNNRCTAPDEHMFVGTCPTHEVRLPTTVGRNVTLVLGGMQNSADVRAALAIPGLSHLYLYNNAADEQCTATDYPGANCGMRCAQLIASAGAVPRGLSMECIDRPNLGRGEAGFFKYVVDHYATMNGAVIFSQSTLSNSEGRLAPVTELVRTAYASGTATSGPPACSLTSDSLQTMCPGQLLTAGADWSIFRPTGRSCASCAPNPLVNTSDVCPTLCNVSLNGDRVFYNMGTATPPTMEAWLRTHAPGPNTTVAPACYLGFARSNAQAIRMRSRAQYAAILEQLNKCPNPEAAHFVERAMLYLFASI